VKGQSVAAYDPRAMLGNGVTFATSPMGADHTAGNVVGEYLEQKLNPLNAEGQVETSRNLQIATAAADCTGICFMAYVALTSPEAWGEIVKAINAKSGTQLTPEGLIGMGVRVLKTEKEFNRKAGFTNKDDRLPKFYYEEPLPPHNTVFSISDEKVDSTFDF
jgi:aldehyde:ferredoxin oxidoreductase